MIKIGKYTIVDQYFPESMDHIDAKTLSFFQARAALCLLTPQDNNVVIDDEILDYVKNVICAPFSEMDSDYLAHKKLATTEMYYNMSQAKKDKVYRKYLIICLVNRLKNIINNSFSVVVG